MPGKNVGEYAWRYMTPFKNVYTVLDVGAFSPDSDPETDGVDLERNQLSTAYQSLVNFAFLLGAAVTSATVELWLDPKVEGFTDKEKWCKIGSFSLTGSKVEQVPDMPLGTVKVLITAAAGGGGSAGNNDNQITVGYATSP